MYFQIILILAKGILLFPNEIICIQTYVEYVWNLHWWSGS